MSDLSQHMMHLQSVLQSRPIPMKSEGAMHDHIMGLLEPFKGEREYVLDTKSRIDVFIPSSGVGIEIKLKESPFRILKQLERYADYDQIRGLILVSATAIRLPEEIRGKPSIAISAGLTWL